MSNLALRRLCCALAIGVFFISSSLAHADSGIPPALRNLKVFEGGTSTLPQLHIVKLNVKPRVGPASVFDKVTGNKFVITSHTPVVPGVIAFMYSSNSGGQMTILPWGPIEYAWMTGSDDLKTAPWTAIALNAAAGKSYLVDVNMYASAPSGSTAPCAIDIAGPNSDQQSSCATNYDSQDIAFIYKADKANVAVFRIAIQGGQASAQIYSATMAVLP